MLKTSAVYLIFCDNCGIPQHIPQYILQNYIAIGVDGVYCKNCEKRIHIPEFLRKIAAELE
ncbi:hypothetical protein [Bacillus salipaludis]|uniref:hypothetical protein n=1 Tax=Bacillus salipaludis TaxID=2547811 RepID=UPI002E1DDDE0|nr:hypothetical protein [Bacillus salipaludis]